MVKEMERITGVNTQIDLESNLRKYENGIFFLARKKKNCMQVIYELDRKLAREDLEEHIKKGKSTIYYINFLY